MHPPPILAQLIETLRAGGVRRYKDAEVELTLDYAGEPGSSEAHNLAPSGATLEPATEEKPQTDQERHISHMELLLQSSGVAVPARLKELPKRAD